MVALANTLRRDLMEFRNLVIQGLLRVPACRSTSSSQDTVQVKGYTRYDGTRTMTDIQKFDEEYAKEYMAHHDRESRLSGNSVQFRIYLFDDNLRDSAKKLLHQDFDITICDCTYKDHNDCKSIAATSDHYLSCCKPRRGVWFTTGIFDIQCRSFHDLMSDKYADDASVCDVAIIMGHSSALFAEDYNVITGLAQMKPTVVAFVGCGEGNARFGPVANISHMHVKLCVRGYSDCGLLPKTNIS